MIRALTAIILGALLINTAQAATITIIPGAGFSDTTPFTPVGGNTATTLGQARLQLFQRVAALWGAKINSSQVIYASVYFTSLSCSSSQALLGQTAPNGFFKNFPNAPKSNVYYPEALAFALAGKRIDNSNPSSDPNTADIQAEFNSAIDSSPSCLNGMGFYYGLDNNPGGKIDLLNTVMHEFGHGLGFISFVDESTGEGLDSNNPNQLGIYDQFVYDETQNQYWPQLTAAQRSVSAINDTHLVWNGAAVNSVVSDLTAGVTASRHVELYAPNPDEPGSSISHWSDIVAPHLLMEPFDSPTVKATLGVDFTTCALSDMGWSLAVGINCPDNVTGNTPPVANAQSVQTNENSSLPITLTATDANSDPLTYSVQVSPTHGTLSGSAPNLTYMPSANYSGADSFQFVVNDGKSNSSLTTISITVNSADISASNSNSGASGSSSGSGSGGGGSMPNLLWFLIPLGLRQWLRLRASRR